MAEFLRNKSIIYYDIITNLIKVSIVIIKMQLNFVYMCLNQCTAISLFLVHSYKMHTNTKCKWKLKHREKQYEEIRMKNKCHCESNYPVENDI